MYVYIHICIVVLQEIVKIYTYMNRDRWMDGQMDRQMDRKIERKIDGYDEIREEKIM